MSQLGRWEVDSVVNTDALTLLKGLPDASVDAVITDPPYGLGGHAFEGNRGMFRADNGKPRETTYTTIDETWDMAAPLDWFEETERILKPGGSVLIFAGKDSVYAFAAEGLRRGWLLVNDITWVKKNPPPCFTGRQMTMATERLLWFCPDGTRWTYNSAAAKDMNRGVNLKDVWTFGVEQGDGRIHPAQKPLNLMERCVLLFTNPDDLVVDPFAGSGTTGAAAIKNGRRFIGSDTDAGYVDPANRRLALPFTPYMFAALGDA